MQPRLTLGALLVVGLALTACGSDDSASSSGDVPTPADLDNRSFSSTEVSGHELVDGSSITIEFEADAMAANAGCNTLSGGFSFDEDALVAGPFAMTMMACDQGLMDQDTWLSDFLSTEPKVALDGTTLTLTGEDATIVLDEVADAELDGAEWSLSGIVAGDGVTSVPADSTASIAITGETVAVDTGCNTGSGGVVVGDDTLTFEPIATTRKACPPEVMAVETDMLTVLQGEVSYEISGNTLSLRSPDGTTGLEFTTES